MDKRTIFSGRLLPYALLAPQLLVTFVFFYWPAGPPWVTAWMMPKVSKKT